MHGLGDSADNLSMMLHGFASMFFPTMKIVLPQAPHAYVSGRDAMMNSWFDIYADIDRGDEHALELARKKDMKNLYMYGSSQISQSDLRDASDYQLDLADEESKKLNGDMSKVIIGGFSQGCMVSLASLIRQRGNKALGGMIAFSGVPNYEKINSRFSPGLRSMVRKTPMYYHIGDKDRYFDANVARSQMYPIRKMYINPEDGKLSKNFSYIEQKGHGHTLSMDAFTGVTSWLK